jgi:hypothetical protein
MSMGQELNKEIYRRRFEADNEFRKEMYNIYVNCYFKNIF